MKKPIVIVNSKGFTPYAKSLKPQTGAWAVLLQSELANDKLIEGISSNSNSVRIQLEALVHALSAIHQPEKWSIIVYTPFDQIKYIAEDLPRWAKNNWLRSNDEEVKNKDLWQQLWDIIVKCNGEIQFFKEKEGQIETLHSLIAQNLVANGVLSNVQDAYLDDETKAAYKAKSGKQNPAKPATSSAQAAKTKEPEVEAFLITKGRPQIRKIAEKALLSAIENERTIMIANKHKSLLEYIAQLGYNKVIVFGTDPSQHWGLEGWNMLINANIESLLNQIQWLASHHTWIYDGFDAEIAYLRAHEDELKALGKTVKYVDLNQQN